MTKLNDPSSLAKLSSFLQAISPEPRLEILLAIGAGEVCVCHLEAALTYRQAFISQHLMTLREAGLVTDRREGRYVFYQLSNPAVLDVLRQLAQMQRVELPVSLNPRQCDCPSCNPNADK
ncbi:MAG: metalloregulator ArsR/SmtB family transcription factor [Chloroflexota bacterium]